MSGKNTSRLPHPLGVSAPSSPRPRTGPFSPTRRPVPGSGRPRRVPGAAVRVRACILTEVTALLVQLLLPANMPGLSGPQDKPPPRTHSHALCPLPFAPLVDLLSMMLKVTSALPATKDWPHLSSCHLHLCKHLTWQPAPETPPGRGLCPARLPRPAPAPQARMGALGPEPPPPAPGSSARLQPSNFVNAATPGPPCHLRGTPDCSALPGSPLSGPTAPRSPRLAQRPASPSRTVLPRPTHPARPVPPLTFR